MEPLAVKQAIPGQVNSRLFELARVLVRFDHVARFMVNAVLVPIAPKFAPAHAQFVIHVILRRPDKMSVEIKKEIQLEIAHVLFVDIVSYSKLSINEQHAAGEELNQIVRASEQFQRAEAARFLCAKAATCACRSGG